MRSASPLLFRILVIVVAVALHLSGLQAQQTLGGITGEFTDPSGGVIPNVTVSLLDENTASTRTVKTNASGIYIFVNLPISSYTLIYTPDGFDTQKTPHISMQANRTATVNAQLRVAAAKGETIEVDAVPL